MATKLHPSKPLIRETGVVEQGSNWIVEALPRTFRFRLKGKRGQEPLELPIEVAIALARQRAARRPPGSTGSLR